MTDPQLSAPFPLSVCYAQQFGSAPSVMGSPMILLQAFVICPCQIIAAVI